MFELKTKLINWFYYGITLTIYKPFFKKIGYRSKIVQPLRIDGAKNIILRDRVIINRYTWILTVDNTQKPPLLYFDDGATIGHFNHITCVAKVYIGKNVLTADRVYISDNYHGYEDISKKIQSQEVKSKGEVYIGDETWIGDNVSILSCKIGKHCVIGANSVVNRDVPDYSVVVGAPGRIVKRYNKLTNKWGKTDNNGVFLDEI